MELSLQLAQKQVLSQKQQQSVEILQMNTLALSDYAKELAQENPVLEWSEESRAEEQPAQRLLQKLQWLEESDEQNRGFARVERDEEQRPELGQSQAQSLQEYLLFQINILKIPEDHKKVLRFLAENTAASGYLESDALEALAERYHLKEKTAERILRQFQHLDPIGVGARDLRECLLIQLREKGASALACAIAAEHLEDLAKNRLSYLARKKKLSIEEIQAAAAEIRACEPKPGRAFAEEVPVEYVYPDVLVEQSGDELAIIVNGGAVPRLQISPAYAQLLRAGADTQTQEYIAEKVKQAEWALQCIARRESTLKRTAEAIVRRQRAFFLSPKGQLAPLRMADIAAELGVHESTVSRAVKEKYLQCERGVFPLQMFFSKEIAAEGEGVSADSICNRLRALIEQEDARHPLSDRELTEKLTAEGIRISRRTVAKYREGMGIATASGRKSY